MRLDVPLRVPFASRRNGSISGFGLLLVRAAASADSTVLPRSSAAAAPRLSAVGTVLDLAIDTGRVQHRRKSDIKKSAPSSQRSSPRPDLAEASRSSTAHSTRSGSGGPGKEAAAAAPNKLQDYKLRKMLQR